jgi:uncharacterized membrane-anchored protein
MQPHMSRTTLHSIAIPSLNILLSHYLPSRQSDIVLFFYAFVIFLILGATNDLLFKHMSYSLLDCM